MADTKISNLNALPAPAEDDVFAIVDISVPETKKISFSEFKTALFNIETPGGLINGSNLVYTTLKNINTVVGLFVNSSFIHPDQYSVSGSGFTMTSAIPSNFSGLGFTIVYL